MIVKTDAIVLRTMKFKEASKILTLYTREYGKLSAIAKGCRGPKSRFGSSLEPMNYVTAVIYRKEDRELQLITQCDLVKPFRRLCEDIEKMYAGMTVVALLDKVTHAEKHESLFAAAVTSLDGINDATQNPVNVLYNFEISLLGLLGFKPNFRTCSTCGRNLDGSSSAGLHLAMGGVLCAECSGAWVGDGRISAQGLRELQRLQACEEMSELTRLSMDPGVRNELRDVLRRYLQKHVEGLQNLKTEEVFAALLGSS